MTARLICASLLLVSTGAAAKEPKLVYALPVSLAPAISYVAVDKGFFKEEGLEIEDRMFSSGREGLLALLGKQAQIQTVSETPMVHAILQGNKFVTVATVARHKETKLIAREDSGIRRPEDLIGKRVATLPGTNSDYFMYRFLSANDIPPKSLKIANMSPPEMVVAFVKGDIDAYFAWEPHIYYARRRAPRARIFAPGNLYSGWAAVNMDPDFVRENPEAVRKVLRALIKAEAYLKAHKDECIRLVAKRIKMDEKIVRDLWEEYVYQVELDKSLVEQMDDIGRWARRLNKSDRPFPVFRDYVDDKALLEERPGSVHL